MNTVFRTRSRAWAEIQSNLLFVGLIELLIYNGGLQIKYSLQERFDPFTPLVGPEYGIYYNANFWIACGFHTAWNYTQTCLFATSNSGEASTVGLFPGTVNAGNGFYHEIYGYEGSFSAAILFGAAILWLVHRLRKEGKI